ncbi:MAG: response regulator [Pirellulaceae bacterium]
MPKILIVDDEPSVRLSIRAVLNRHDLIIFEAETPDEAIRATLAESPDVVLLDIRLGATSGLALFHELHRLDNVIRQALIGSAGSTIVTEFLPAELLDQDHADTEDLVETQSMPDANWQTLHQNFTEWLGRGETDLYRRAREQFDQLVIFGAMQHVGGNRSQASKILGLSHVTLRAKLRSMCVREATSHTKENPADE